MGDLRRPWETLEGLFLKLHLGSMFSFIWGSKSAYGQRLGSIWGSKSAF